ncbi:DNA repair protein RecN [Canibacter zhoujuaniae]|uniref:DNA repair protein RecN n=1 Tax=Canibacter zhoujuaniae TaxID=2708343 RepID=UPI001423012E|nr:DNA repair protein RecN [Canibacter zhoujuaniae]
MIEELEIKDLGVIAQTTLPLGPGFTTITGETGAGKTMVVTALSLLMGARSDSSLVRSGAAQARIGGVIGRLNIPAVAALVDEAGGEIEEGELLLSRTVRAEGASRATVGGVRAPASVLSQLAQHLFCLHGQSDQLRLRSQTEQRETLDRFGGSAIGEALTKYISAYERLSALQQEVSEIAENRAARCREAEQLRAEINEISAVDPQENETAEVTALVEKLAHAEQLRAAVAGAANALSGDDSGADSVDALSILSIAIEQVREGAHIDSTLADSLNELESVLAQTQSVARDLFAYGADLEAGGPAELAAAQQRLADLKQLERNYGPELSDVLAYFAAANDRLLLLDQDDDRLAILESELNTAREDHAAAATELSELRSTAAARLSQLVTAELKHLALPEAALEISVAPREAGSHGADEVLFLLRSHQGATPAPLARAASGGELSRIMLAIEVVLAGTDPVPTFVFDEIDAGIGGAAAIEVGRRLKKLSQTAQVIVVTHLPQVAAFADNHLRVLKDSAGGYTESSCQQLVGEEREKEIARLLSGLTDSDSAREHARELLDMGVSNL